MGRNHNSGRLVNAYNYTTILHHIFALQNNNELIKLGKLSDMISSNFKEITKLCGSLS